MTAKEKRLTSYQQDRRYVENDDFTLANFATFVQENKTKCAAALASVLVLYASMTAFGIILNHLTRCLGA